MTEIIANFVSKRLQRVAFALVCLMTIQLGLTLASCQPELAAPMAARVQVGR